MFMTGQATLVMMIIYPKSMGGLEPVFKIAFNPQIKSLLYILRKMLFVQQINLHISVYLNGHRQQYGFRDKIDIPLEFQSVHGSNIGDHAVPKPSLTHVNSA